MAYLNRTDKLFLNSDYVVAYGIPSNLAPCVWKEVPLKYPLEFEVFDYLHKIQGDRDHRGNILPIVKPYCFHNERVRRDTGRLTAPQIQKDWILVETFLSPTA